MTFLGMTRSLHQRRPEEQHDRGYEPGPKWTSFTPSDQKGPQTCLHSAPKAASPTSQAGNSSVGSNMGQNQLLATGTDQGRGARPGGNTCPLPREDRVT